MVNELTKLDEQKAQQNNFLTYIMLKRETSIQQKLIKIRIFENKVQF